MSVRRTYLLEYMRQIKEHLENDMKLCNCGKPVEAARYSMCNSCWKLQDPRYVENAQEYLHEMSKLATRHNLIVAESLEIAKYTYEPLHGPKLYWDVTAKHYVMKMPDGSVLTPKGKV